MRFERQIIPGDNVRLEVDGMKITNERRRVTGKGHIRAFNAVGKVAVDGFVSFALINPDKK